MSQPDPHQAPFEALLRRALVFNHIYEALVVTAEDDTILDWNAGAERLFGWPREEVLGQPLHAVYRPTASGGNGTSFGEIVQRMGRWQGEVQFVRKDGGTATCEVVGLPLRDANEKRVRSFRREHEDGSSSGLCAPRLRCGRICGSCAQRRPLSAAAKTSRSTAFVE